MPNKPAPIVVELVTYRNNIIGTILYQTSGIAKGSFSWTCGKTGYSVISASNPELNTNAIYLRGKNSNLDEQMMRIACLNESDRDRRMKKYKETIEEFCKYCIEQEWE